MEQPKFQPVVSKTSLFSMRIGAMNTEGPIVWRQISVQSATS